MATNEEQKRKQLEENKRVQQENLRRIHEESAATLEHTEGLKDTHKVWQKIISAMAAGREVSQELLIATGETGDEYDDILKTLEPMIEAQKKIRDELKKADKELEKFNKRLEAGKKAMDALNKGVGSLSAGFAKISGIDLKKIFDDPLSLVGTFVDLAKELDTAGVGLGRLTGQVGMNKAAINGLVERNKDLAINQQEAAKIQGELFTSYSDFFFMSQDMQKQTADLGATFERLGLSSQDLGGFMDNLTRGMRFSKGAALEASESLANFASKMGVPPKELAADFNSLAKELAKYGTKGLDVFKTLQKTAKSLAMNVKDAMKIAELFDTFSGAAETVGLLNAQLGLGLNGVTMMHAEEGERLEILRQRFKVQGREFDSLHRREQQAIAKMLKVEVSLASRLFGDKETWAEVEQKQEDARAKAQALTSVVERLQTAFLRLAPALEWASNLLADIVEKIAEHKDVALFVVGFVALNSITWKLLKVLSLVVPGLQGLAGSAAATGPAMAAASVGAIPLSLAILAIAAGVGVAAVGLSYLVAEFAKMDAAQIAASALAILAIGGAIGIVSFGLAALIPLIPAVTITLGTLALGLAAFGVVASIGIWAMSSLGKSFMNIGEGLSKAASAMSELSFSQFTAMSSALTGLRNSLTEFLVILGQMGLTGNMGMLMTFFDDLATKSQGFDAIKMNAATDLLLTTKEVLIAAPQAGGEQNINRVKDVISATASGGGGDPGLKKSIDSLVRALNNPRATGAKGGSQKPFNIIVKIDGADAAEALWPKLEPHFNKTG